ncbi:ATP-binding protein [Niveibacterium sp. 24ML]|uniref:sensor histidine kinase n=1 Tax=Niveibacterium sp. 24ML TaxID=2985512 RepID=UPI00226E3A29|nr:ATP-binding protein [Niveibacterium sp. 24ML]MCX9156977.1 ATP-binding protein [Niveibacterium sp. 24ML]
MEAASDQVWQAAESRWRSLRYYSFYRLIVACGLAFIGRMFLNDNPGADSWGGVVGAYIAAALVLLYFYRVSRAPFEWVLNVHILIDVLALASLMYIGGGLRGGLPYMLMVVVAAGGLLGEGRLVFFYASVASIAVFIAQGMVSLRASSDFSAEIAAGAFVCTGFFAIATVARLLATRALANEKLAHQRGAALRRQIQVNEQIITDLHDGVLVLDRDGVVLQINRKASELLGDTPGVGMPLEILSPTLATAVAAGSEAADITDDGRRVRVRTYHLGAQGDTIVYLEDLERLEREAQQIKLAALGRLTGSIAHEIRNPLAAISHASELLAEEKRAEMQQRLTRIINDNTLRIDRMVRDVLELGRRDRATPESIPLHDFISTFLHEQCAYEGWEPGLVVIEGDASLRVCFDRIHLQQIAWNLIGNARRFASGAPGSVVVKVLAEQNETVALHVIDDGPGVPQPARSKIFEPFFTSDPRGTGLGLYIARELAQANNAELELCDTRSGAHFKMSAKEWV